MRQVISQTGTGSSNWLPVDHTQAAFGIGIGVVVSGTVTYTVEHTFDDVLAAASATAFPHASLVTKTANSDGNYAFPVAAVRVTVTAGTGTATMTMLQGRR